MRSIHATQQPLSPLPPLSKSLQGLPSPGKDGSPKGSPHGQGGKRAEPDSPFDETGPENGAGTIGAFRGTKAARMAVTSGDEAQLVDAILRWGLWVRGRAYRAGEEWATGFEGAGG